MRSGGKSYENKSVSVPIAHEVYADRLTFSIKSPKVKAPLRQFLKKLTRSAATNHGNGAESWESDPDVAQKNSGRVERRDGMNLSPLHAVFSIVLGLS